MEDYVALFIDGDNISHKYCETIINIVKKKYGKIIVARVYGDFSKDELKYWETPSVIYNIEPVLVWRLGGKNSSDLRLTADAIELFCGNQNISKFVLVSGDKDYTILVSKLKIKDIYVIGISESNHSTSLMLKNCCDEFILLQEKHIKSTKFSNLETGNLDQLKKNIITLLENNNESMLRISQLKDKLLQIDSSFTESNYGFESFSKLLESFDELSLEKYDTTLFVTLNI